MFAPVLVTDDPYAAAATFSAAGWKVDSAVDRQDLTPRAAVSLASARLILVAAAAGDPRVRGGGVELQLHVPPYELAGLFLLHRAAGLATSELRRQPWGERGFRAEIAGYRFLVLGGDPDPDLALIGTDPRIVALADGLRQRDGLDSLTDAALRMVEGAGESVKSLRRAVRGGLSAEAGKTVGPDLAEVVIAAAILARQLGVDLETDIDTLLGSPTWLSQA